MTLLPVCGWSLLRSAVVCLLVLPPARTLARTYDGGTRSVRFGIGLCLILLCAIPDLAVGYAWADTGTSLGDVLWANEVLYVVLLAGKLLPMAVVLCAAMPADPVSATARHVLKLAGASRCQVGWMIVRGRAPSLAPTVGVIFLLAFQDFELSARMGVRAWAISLFDLHARQGLPVLDSVQLTLLPVLIELAIILPALHLALSRSILEMPHVARPVRPLPQTAASLTLLALVALVCIVPSMLLFRGAFLGGSVLLRDAVHRVEIPRQIARGLMVGLISAAGAFHLGWLLAESLRASRPFVRWGLVPLAVVPGLLGGLVLSLVGRFGVQQLDAWWEASTGLRGLYHTPVPLILVQTLLLLPRATLIAVLLERLTRTSATHLGHLLSRSSQLNQRRTASELLWHGRWRGQFWAIVLLTWWGYWDLTTFSLLAPTGFDSAPVKLYNLMHYRQNLVVSSILLAAIVVPGVVVLVAWLTVRTIRRTVG